MNHKLIYNCPEKWDAMKNAPNGKFCDRCQKTVIDLDKHPAPKVKKFCGKKTITTQTIILNYPQIVQNAFLKRVIVFLTAILLLRKMEAQDTIPKKNSEQLKFPLQSNGTEKETKVSGIVIDKANKEPIPFANVIAEDEEGKKIGISQTDLEGKFNMVFQLDSVRNNTISVKVTYVGYSPVMITKVPKNKHNLVLELKQSTGEEFITVGIYISTPEDFSPDPFSSGSKLTREQIKNRAK